MSSIPAVPVPLKWSVNPPSLWLVGGPPGFEFWPPPPHSVAWPTYCTVPSDEVKTAGPVAVNPPQSPFLFSVPCETECPPTKLSDQASDDRNAGQLDGIETNGGGGPVKIGPVQVGSDGSQCVVPFCVEDPADAAPTPAARTNTAATSTTLAKCLLNAATSPSKARLDLTYNA